VTAVDFTQGMTMSIGGLVNLDADVKSGFVSQLQTIEQAVGDGDAELASTELQVLREMVVRNADQLDFAAGAFSTLKRPDLCRPIGGRGHTIHPHEAPGTPKPGTPKLEREP